jgi:hypothetical protein
VCKTIYDTHKVPFGIDSSSPFSILIPNQPRLCLSPKSLAQTYFSTSSGLAPFQQQLSQPLHTYLLKPIIDHKTTSLHPFSIHPSIHPSIHKPSFPHLPHPPLPPSLSLSLSRPGASSTPRLEGEIHIIISLLPDDSLIDRYSFFLQPGPLKSFPTLPTYRFQSNNKGNITHPVFI